jgi:hypothetical protein
VRDVRHGATAANADAADTVGVLGGEGASPAADVEGILRVRRAERVRQPLDETAASPMDVVEPDAKVKATACGPCRSATRRIAAAVRSSASSQPIRCQRASASPFGRVRRSGQVRRSG